MMVLSHTSENPPTNMKKLFTHKYLLVFILLCFGSIKMNGQALLLEDFSYITGTALTANGYIAISGAGTNAITVTNPGLSPAGSPSSGIDNAVTMTTSGEDGTKSFSPTITSGDAYASFFINVSSAQTGGDYFFALYDGGFKGRLWIKSSGAGFVFGISKNSNTITYESTIRNFSTTHLVVLKYTFNQFATDDVVSLYVNPVLGLPEPTATIAATTSGGAGDAVTIDRIALRQGTTTAASAQVIDGIRVGTTWASVTPVSTQTTPCPTPTAPATSLVFGTITDTTITASFTAASPATDNYLIVMSANSALISNPVNGQIYNIGDNVGDGSVITEGAATSFTATGLTALSTYYFFVFPMNAICTGGPLYYTTTVLNGNATTIAGLPPCVTPTTQPTGLTFGATTPTSVSGSFTATTANQYLIVRSLSALLGANPLNTTLYNIGDALGNGMVVQRSSAISFTASGLAPNTPYNFFVFSSNNEACINGPAYNSTSPLTGSQSTIPLLPCVAPASQPTNLNLTASNNLISGTFTGTADADDYLVVKSTSATLGATPTDNTDYLPGDIFGSGTVISNTSNTSFVATNLSVGTTYYFFVFDANKTCSGGSRYSTQMPLTAGKLTTNNPSNNYYFGTLHSHSDYSDGNKDNPGFTPAQDYAFAKNSLCLDYLGISEHNHFSSANNPGNQINNFHQGSIQANNFTAANPSFLAMYGMEWGVISGGGHVVVYGDGMDDLWGWETGSGTWGPTNNYDTYVPKSVYTGNTGLFKTVNDNAVKNTFATLAHPNLSDYNNIANIGYDAIADNAIVGAAVESGPAFSTNTSYSNPGSSLSYLHYYQVLLSKGYHLGPTIDHDNHNTTFGRTTTSRTAIMATALTKTAIVSAMRNMNFYATQDCDTKVDFSINTKMMGSVFTDRFAPNISVSLTDATTSLSSAIIRLMHGIPGSGANATKIDSAIGSSLQFTDASLADLVTGYYYIDVTNGSSRIITSPIWYSRNDALLLPVKLSTFSVQKAGKSAQLDWITNQETNSSHFIIQRSANGRIWNDIARVNAAANSSIRLTYKAYDNTPVNGTNYYRLKQFDNDGRFEISAVKSINFKTAYDVNIWPNPAKDFININLAKSDNELLNIQLTDIAGKVVKSLSSAQAAIKISTVGIAKGLYFISIKNNSNSFTQKIIID